MKFSRLFPLLALLFPFALLAQAPPKFGEKPEEFVKLFEPFMTASHRPDMEESFKVFQKAVSAGQVSSQELGRIQKMANLMAGAKNLSAHPYFKNYLNAVAASELDQDSTLFDRWHLWLEQTMATAVRGKTKPVLAVLEFSQDFMLGRNLMTGEQGSVTWRIYGRKFQFKFDSVPSLECQGVNLVGLRKTDSVVVVGTSGQYFPVAALWRGLGGRVTWQRHGLDSTVRAELGRYQVEVVKPIFTCDKAKLYYPLYFQNTPVEGKFEDNVTPDRAVSKQYPRFESFDKKLKINKIGEGISYEGGFRLQGTSVYGYGVAQEHAEVQMFNKKHERVFRGLGNLFIIEHEKSIVAEAVDAKLFMGEDSMTHPSVLVRVQIPEQIINMTRGLKGSERNPFYSSYYAMNLDVEQVKWFLNLDSLEIGSRVGITKGTEQTATFESNNHYDVAEYARMQSIGDKNPISVLMVVDKENGGSGVVKDNQFAYALNPKFDYSSIQTLLADLVAKGFINYYFDQHIIEVREKLRHYANASQGKKDYDYINIESTTTGVNAQLNLRTKETALHAVKKLELSRKQKVGVVPDGQEIVLLQNRDMRLKGRLFAGFALFEGNKMHFDYAKYQVDLDSCRHLDFYLPTGDVDPKTQQPKADAMNSTIEFVTGVLLIDAPNNKSGKEDLPIFPSLQTKAPSFVFYDRPQTQGGVYKRDSFYFKLEPFPFNGLDKYVKEDLKFKGTMQPALIFPPFKESILVRDEDKSFGFIHKTPPTGYPTYQKKGKYTGEVDLSNKGFLGKGTVNYLTADIQSEDIIFRPKQMTCTAKKFFMTEDRASEVKVPQAKGEDVKVNWLPFRDSMYVESKAKAFELFKAPGYTHKGTLILTPSGLKGKGVFEWAGGRLTSKLIAYGPFQAKADTADLQIKALQGNDIAFDSRNVRGELDFDAQKGHFKANADTASTTLPLDKYKTSMNEFTWGMAAQTIDFKSKEGQLGNFMSIDPGQDSLFFRGQTAHYDMKSNLLQIGGVPYIKSADAFIYTEKGDIEIASGGKMKELKNCQIIADTINKYHQINRATVQVRGKKEYTAKGYYAYDITGYKQELFFDNIVGQRHGGGNQFTKNVRTTASGQVEEKANFRMDVKTFFKGEVNLDASKKNIRFDGLAKLDAPKMPGRQWFTVNAELDRTNPQLKIRGCKNAEEEPLITGFFLSTEYGQCYPRILLPAHARVDRPFMDCQGFLRYDPAGDKFVFGDTLRVADEKAKLGSRMTFENRTGDIIGEGPISLGSGLEYMKLKAAGKLKSDFNVDTSGSYRVSGEFMVGAEIIIPKALTDVMINDIRQTVFDAAPPAIMTQLPFYEPAVSNFVTDDRDRNDALNLLKTNQLVLPPKDNKFSFLLGKHNVIWNPEYSSFLGVDEKIPLISIAGEPIAKTMTTYVEYKMPGNKDDRFYLYIKATADLWYFFGYQAGALYCASSSTRFTDAMLSLKKKDLQQKMPDGELYEIIPSNASTAQQFVNRVVEGRQRN